MRGGYEFAEEFERLRRHTNAHKRGYEFQAFVGDLFRSQHFKVERKARVATPPRQVDLLASRGGEVYLIETKWQKAPATVDDIDSLFRRVEASPAHVVGIMVSYSGFAPSVIERVRLTSNRPVLLMADSDLDYVLGWNGNLLSLLRRKRESLLVHREVSLSSDPAKARRIRRAPEGELIASDSTFVFPDGRRTEWLSCSGDFGQFVFIQDLPDIDWVPGSGRGVAAEIAVTVWSEGELIDVLRQLSDMGWATPEARWSIQQSTTNWHGGGAKEFARVLADWSTRYEGIETHHSEEFCYFDTCDGGFYTLTANLSAHKSRQVHHAHLSFEFTGIPLDTEPLRQLCDSLKVTEPVYFRPRADESVTRTEPPAGELPRLTPVAFVVKPNALGSDPNGADWVAGIVVENPYRRARDAARHAPPDWVPRMVEDSAYLICDLRSWHQFDNAKSTYRLWYFETAWTSNALVVRAVADWDDEESDREESIPILAYLEGAEEEGVQLVEPKGLRVPGGIPLKRVPRRTIK